MGLSAVFDDGPGPRGVGDIADDGLAAWIDVDMFDSDLLFAAPSQLGERINLSGEGPCQAMQREAVLLHSQPDQHTRLNFGEAAARRSFFLALRSASPQDRRWCVCGPCLANINKLLADGNKRAPTVSRISLSRAVKSLPGSANHSQQIAEDEQWYV